MNDERESDTSRTTAVQPAVVHHLGGDLAIILASTAELERFGFTSGVLPDGLSAMIRDAAATLPQLATAHAALTGRIVKLTDRSATLLKQHGGQVHVDGGIAGWVRHTNGQFAGNLSFTRIDLKTALAGPLGAIATYSQMRQLEQRLHEISQGIDYLADHASYEVEAGIIAAARTCEELYCRLDRSGSVSDDDYALLAGAHQRIAELVELTKGHLRPLLQLNTAHGRGIGRRADALASALEVQRVEFWIRAFGAAERTMTQWLILRAVRDLQTRSDETAQVTDALRRQLAERCAKNSEMVGRAHAELAQAVSATRLREMPQLWDQRGLRRNSMRLEPLLLELGTALEMEGQPFHVGTSRARNPEAVVSAATKKVIDRGRSDAKRVARSAGAAVSSRTRWR